MSESKDFSEQYPNDPEQGMRAALSFLVSTSGVPAKHLAADIGQSPSDFSRMIALSASEDGNHRRNMPLGTIINLMLQVKNVSPVLTMLGYLGYDSSRLHEIRRATKSPAQLQEELIEQVKAAQATIQRVAEQLPLCVPLTESVPKRGIRR